MAQISELTPIAEEETTKEVQHHGLQDPGEVEALLKVHLGKPPLQPHLLLLLKRPLTLDKKR